MQLKKFYSLAILLLILVSSCGESPKKNESKETGQEVQKDSIATDTVEKEKEKFLLTEENAIDFLNEFKLDIVHIHANNSGPLNKNGDPTTHCNVFTKLSIVHFLSQFLSVF